MALVVARITSMATMAYSSPYLLTLAGKQSMTTLGLMLPPRAQERADAASDSGRHQSAARDDKFLRARLPPGGHCRDAPQDQNGPAGRTGSACSGLQTLRSPNRRPLRSGRRTER